MTLRRSGFRQSKEKYLWLFLKLAVFPFHSTPNVGLKISLFLPKSKICWGFNISIEKAGLLISLQWVLFPIYDIFDCSSAVKLSLDVLLREYEAAANVQDTQSAICTTYNSKKCFWTAPLVIKFLIELNEAF